jgi:hypothetical protein
MSEQADVPTEIVAAVRSCCSHLPEAYEELAWVGTRWRVRKRTFAHVLRVDGGWPPAYAQAVEHDGPLTVLMFRSAGEELAGLRDSGRPFFAPRWRADEVGMVLPDDLRAVDWSEVTELLTESYCAVAPKMLRARVARPS